MEGQNTVSINDFQIIRKLGQGTFGSVFISTFKPTGDIVALKRMKKENATESAIIRFRREARIMKKMSHPAIVQFFGSFETENSIFIAMEYIDGQTLDRIVNNTTNSCCDAFCQQDNQLNEVALPENVAMRHFVELLCILKHLHRKEKVVHRDLKLDNLIIEKNGNLRIIDFGLSNIDECAKCSMFKTACGTVGYTAPEVIKREPYNDKVDIWSAAIILYTMVTGHLPFLHENLQEVYQQIISKDPYFPPNLSKEMVDLISLLLNKEPNERPSFEDIFEIPIVAKTVSEHSNIVNYLLQQPLRESTNKSNSDLNEDKSYEEDINENEAKNREKDHIFLTCTKNEIASRIRNLMKLKSTLMNNGLITNSNSVEQIAFPRKVFRPIPRIASSKHQGVKIVSIPFPVRINSPPVKIIPNKNQAIMIPTVSNQIALPNMQIFQPHLRRSTF